MDSEPSSESASWLNGTTLGIGLRARDQDAFCSHATYLAFACLVIGNRSSSSKLSRERKSETRYAERFAALHSKKKNPSPIAAKASSDNAA